MLNMLWPILLVVAANTVYNISAKSTPVNINLFASITLTCVLLIVGFLLYKEALSLRQILGMVVCAVGLILTL